MPEAPIRRWRTSVWPWPAIAVMVVALAGYLFGTVAAIVVAGQTVATLLFVGGDSLAGVNRRPWLAASSVVAGIAVIAVLVWQAESAGILRNATSGHPGGTANLAGVTVTQSALQHANLRGAILSGARFDGLSLTNLSLAGAIAPGASFVGSDLAGVSLRGADLRGANFSMACLRGSDLHGAELEGANISGADLTGVRISPGTRRTLTGVAARHGFRVSSCR